MSRSQEAVVVGAARPEALAGGAMQLAVEAMVKAVEARAKAMAEMEARAVEATVMEEEAR